MTTQPRFWMLLAVLAGVWTASVLLLLLGAGQPVHAQDGSAGVEPLGRLSGTVTDENGVPLSGIRIDFHPNASPASLRTATTGADGRYTARLVTNLYSVRFSDPAGIYAVQVYRGALALQGAFPVALAGNQVEDINARLTRAGAITGTLHVSARANHLLAYAWVDGEWQAVQEAKGWPQYEIRGLPAGRYRVCFTNPIVGSEDVVPCYQGVKTGLDGATDILLAAGQVITAIDLFGDSATTLDIEGTFPYTIAAPQGDNGGIAGKIAGLPPYDPSSYRAVAIFTLAGEQWRVVKVVNLDGAHRYQVTNLPPGTYRVCLAWHGFTGEDGPCYDHIRRGVEWATDISVTAGKITTADLPMRDFVDGAAISGAITSEDGAPLVGVQVSLRQWVGSPSDWYIAATTYTDAAGAYRIGDLLPGEYVIELWDVNGSHISSWLGGITQTVTLQRLEQRSGVDLHMVLGGVISGAINFAGPYPPASASVIAETVVDGMALTVRGEYNADSGAYVIKQLPPGVYQVRAEIPDPYGAWSNYTAYYSKGAAPGLPTAMTITQGSQIGGIDIRVAEGIYAGVLTGTVTSEAGQPLAGIRVDLYRGTLNPSDQPAFVYTITGEDGVYRFGGLASGYPCELRYSDPAGAYLPVYASNQLQHSNVYGFIIWDWQNDKPLDVQVLPAPAGSPN